MKKFDQAVVKFDRFVPGGQVIGVLEDGRKVFAWGALPGETARVEIYRLKKSYAEAVAMEILAPSPERVEPRDDCYLSTSPWQILDFAAENRAKAELVREAFEQEKISLNHVIPVSRSPELVSGAAEESSKKCHSEFISESSLSLSEEKQEKLKILKQVQDDKNNSSRGFQNDKEILTDGRYYFYRNKMEYALWWDNQVNRIDLAFHKRGSHQKIPIARSSIERPEILAEAQKVVAELNSRGEAARRYQSLLVRCNQTGEVSSALFENGQSRPRMKPLTDQILGHQYSYSPNGFFQINLPVYEMALQEIAANLGDSQKVVDLYAGVGTIGLSVARDRELTLVESDASAFRELVENVSTCAAKAAPSVTTEARKKGSSPVTTGRTPFCASRGNVDTFSVDYTQAVHTKSEEALEFITGDATVILDPPRAGLDAKVIARILETRPPRVIYLSCNPATQARDVARLTAGHSERSEGSTPKYRIVYQQAFNFFPRTPHIENLIILESTYDVRIRR